MNKTITLSTGKVIGIREKKGQHRLIENKLTSMFSSGGINSDNTLNIGSALSIVTVQTLVSIETIDGKAVSIPTNEAEAYELMDNFGYDEWTELEKAVTSKDDQAKIDELAKNSQTSTGSGQGSN
jgi:hypothetical protein